MMDDPVGMLHGRWNDFSELNGHLWAVVAQLVKAATHGLQGWGLQKSNFTVQ